MLTEELLFSKGYDFPEGKYDEVFENPEKIRSYYFKLYRELRSLTTNEFERLYENAKVSFLTQGITYAVYNGESSTGTERIFPFDLFPRIIPKHEWEVMEAGLLQRNLAVNEFVKDIYSDKKILKDKVIPKNLILSSPHYCKEMQDFESVGGIFTHVCGTDIIRHNDGCYYVLEDNLRCPSGVSYVVANREALQRTFPIIFKSVQVHPIIEYPQELLKTLHTLSPDDSEIPFCVVLTPGIYNSAYYEHSFLAQSMGIDLVEGGDLYVENDKVYLRTIYGPKKVDVLYRRIDDAFMDPDVFKPDSVLGVKGIMKAYLKGNITIVNAPGTGISDDKAIYNYVPEIIKYYLNEDPILFNVPTYLCEDPTQCDHVLNNISELVVKPVDMSGGYGVMIGNRLSKTEISDLKDKIRAKPREFIAQPIMSLSTHSTYIEKERIIEPRHIDLRTFTLLGKGREFVLKGGLTRVALKKGSLIVNSSQGGGAKDTWVLEDH